MRGTNAYIIVFLKTCLYCLQVLYYHAFMHISFFRLKENPKFREYFKNILLHVFLFILIFLEMTAH